MNSLNPLKALINECRKKLKSLSSQKGNNSEPEVARTLNLKQKRLYQILSSYLIAQKKLASIFVNPSDKSQAEFNSIWQNVSQELRNKLGADHLYAHVHNRIAKIIREGEQQNLWQFRVPDIIVRTKKPKPAFTRKKFSRLAGSSQFTEKWLSEIIQPNHQVSVYDVVLSFIIHTGLSAYDYLPDLVNKLNHKKPFCAAEDLIWINLSIIPPERSKPYEIPTYTNELIDDEFFCTRRVFPASETLGLYLRYRKGRDSIPEQHIPEKILSHLNNHIKKHSGMNLKQFCKGAFSANCLTNNNYLPEAFYDYASGDVLAFSLPSNQFSALFSNYKATNIIYKKPESVSVSVKNKGHVTTVQVADVLSKLLSTTAQNSHNIFKKEMQDLLTQADITQPQRALLEYLYDLMNKERSLSTIRTYYSKLGKQWLYYSADYDYIEDSDTVDSIYEQIIETGSSAKSRDDKASHIYRFHQFAFFNNEFPATSLDIKGKNHHVKAAFINESLYKALLHTIKNDHKCKDMEIDDALTIAVMLSFRLGLRLSEVLKLTLSDFEWSKECWTYINNNVYGSNKSQSASRRLPLACLLTEQELALFRNYLRSRSFNLRNNRKTNVLLISSALLPKRKLDKNFVSSLVSKALKAISGLPLTFHSLRHSAISRTFLLGIQFLQNTKFGLSNKQYSMLIPYSDDQCLSICATMFREDQNSVFFNIARFAGHSSPEVTFCHYIHFVDLALSSYLNEAQNQYTEEQLFVLSGLSRPSIKQKSSNGTINLLRSEIISKILKRAYASKQKTVKVTQAQFPIFEHQQSHTRAKFVTMFDEISLGANFRSCCARLGIEPTDGALALNKLQVLQAIKTQKRIPAIINPANKNQISLRLHTPEQTGHRFRLYPDTLSVLIRTPIPG